MEKEFKLGKLFSCAKGDVDLQQKDINGRGEFFINSGLENKGIKGRTDKEARVFSANTLTIDFWGNAFYRDFPYKLATHNHVFSLSSEFLKNEKVGLYIEGALAKLPELFSYNNMATWNKLKDLAVSLPVIPSADPAHVYTPADIDWGYMERYIAELEEERVAELEAYLQATGLDDCDLTAKDEATLAKEPTFAEFKASALFEIKKGRRLTKADMIPGKIPFVGSSSDNNGITARIGNAEHLHPANTFTVSYNGSVGEVFLQDEKFWASDDVNVWYPRFTFNRESVQYIMAVVKKLGARYSYNAKWGIEAMKGEVLSLPVIPSADPIHAYTPADIDWGYMERYIKAIEKLVTADVVAYKDKVIEGTRQAITVDKEVQA